MFTGKINLHVQKRDFVHLKKKFTYLYLIYVKQQTLEYYNTHHINLNLFIAIMWHSLCIQRMKK